MRIRTLSLLFATIAALAGCTRSFPSTLPSTSAASSQAYEGTPAVVGLALREEPPLPGESMDGWEALEPPAPAQGGHVHAH